MRKNFIISSIFILTVTLKTVSSAPQYNLKHIDPKEGRGYDLFHFDGETLRDEKVRFDETNKDTVFNRRYGHRDPITNKFHLVETKSDGNGFFSKVSTLAVNAVKDLFKKKLDTPAFRTKDSKNKIPMKVGSDCNELKGDCAVSVQTSVQAINPNALKSLLG